MRLQTEERVIGLVKYVPFSEVSVLHSLERGGEGMEGKGHLAKEQQTPKPPAQEPEAVPCLARHCAAV